MQKKEEIEEYRNVNLKLIDEPDGIIRLDIDDDEIMELSENIREVGQIHPILLARKGKRFEIVVGHRRVLAIKKLHEKTVKATIKVMTKGEIALARASENLQRKNLTPIEEAAVYVDLYNEHGLTIKKIGDKFGVAGTTIKRKMDLLRMPEMIQKAIHSKKIAVGVGEELARIEDKKELKRFIEMAIINGATVEVAKIWTEDFRKSLQYLDSREEPPGPEIDVIETKKYYTACQICEGPLEYQDIVILKVCKGCFKQIMEGLKQ